MVNKQLNIPLYLQIYEHIRNEICSGTYQFGELLPSERELSEFYHVERATVRRALGLLAKDKFIIKVPGLGSKINLCPSSAVPGTSLRNIAFILPTAYRAKISQPFTSSLFFHFEEECHRLGYFLFYTHLQSRNEFNALIQHNPPRAFVFVSQVEKEILQAAKESSIPFVNIARHFDHTPCVFYDNVGGSNQGMEYLIRLGHHRIAFLGGLQTYTNARERFKGYLQALKRHQIEMDESIIRWGDWAFEDGYNNMRSILRMGAKVTAAFCCNDKIALGAMRAALDLGLNVPQDLSVMGFDDIEQCNYVSPSLTSLRIDVKEVAHKTMQLLCQVMENSDTQMQQILCPVKLIVRESTDIPRTRQNILLQMGSRSSQPPSK